MHKYNEQKNESWGPLRKWFETEREEQPLTEVLRISEKAFIRKYHAAYMECENSPENNEMGEEELRKFYRAVSTAAHKARHLFFSLYNLSAGEMPEKAGMLEDLPDFFHNVTSYSDLFSCITSTDSDPDLFSPTAYFADLLRIIETYITSEFDIPAGRRLRDRRPDLYTRLLTKENTETLMPYTDIILERLIAKLQELEPSVFGCNADDTPGIYDSKIKAYCAENVYPVSLPFSMPYNTVAAALTKEGFTPARLLIAFRENPCSEHITAATLGISVDYLKALNSCGSAFYPEFSVLKDSSNVDVNIVLHTTGLTLDELDVLLGRGLETAEEFKLTAPDFYINKGLTTCLELSQDAKNVKGLNNISMARLVRFVRFASLTGLTYQQLDAIILNDNIDSAVSLFAAIQNMSKNAHVLLPLISSLYDYGKTSTFKAVYGDSLSLNKAYDFSSILPSLATTFSVSENEIKALYLHLFTSSTKVSALQLNALYRNTYMASLLGIGIDEYIIIAKLAGIKTESLCSVFSAETISSLLSYDDIGTMNAYEVDFICTGNGTSYADFGFTKEDFEKFLKDIKEQADPLSEEKKRVVVEQGLISFLGIKPTLAELLYSIIPTTQAVFISWEEMFYKDEGKELAYKTAKLLARGNMLLNKIPLDIFALFAKAFFTDDSKHKSTYLEIVSLCKAAKYYTANPIFFMLVADLLKNDKKDNKAKLATLCALSEADIDQLLKPISLSLPNLLQFVSRLDAVKTMNLSISNLTAYLDALTKEKGYSDLLLHAANLPVPSGLSSIYCSALTALTVQKLSKIYRDISTRDALSAYLLLDVQTDEAVQVSYIREGINAALNYLNRSRSGLEPGVGRIDEISEDYWSWIMNFSEWKANRMVFVEPENYLLPDIRSSQSSLFKKALQGVAGKPLNLAEAESLYGKYLDDYGELSTITPCASYLASTKDSEQLYLFGRTETTSGKLHYCIRKDGIWGEWTEISAPIPVTEITPIFIFGKLYIFWIEKPSAAAPEISYAPSAEKGERADDTTPILLLNTPNVTRISVKYTYRNLMGNWNAPQTLFDDDCVVENTDVDYGKQFHNTYDTNGEGYKRLAAFRITERNFCDSSGKYFISQNSEFEKLLIVYGGFTYNFPNETIENYYPLGTPFDTQDKTSFSNKHASICDKLNMLSQQNISGRLCSGSTRIYGSTLREENIVADGEFLLFDEYTGGMGATVPAVATDESSSIISTILTADVLKNPLLPVDKITPKFVGQVLPKYSYTGENTDYRGEFCDTLNTYVLGTNPGKTLKDFQAYLKSVNIAKFSKSVTGEDRNDSGGTVQINPQQLGTTTFYASTSDTGVFPAQFSDLYSILLQCLGSQNLFGSIDNRLASNAEIIKTVNLAGGFILKTGGKGGETFLLTPVPEQSQGKPAQLRPTDGSIVISHPKITADDIEKAIGDCGKNKNDILETLRMNKPPIIDIDGYVYTPDVTESNIINALKRLFGSDVPKTVKEGLLSLLNNRRLASNYMFWSQDIDRKTSVDIFAALTDHPVNSYTVLPVDAAVSMNTNPKVKLRDTQVIGTKTPSEVSSIFSHYVNAPLPVSLRFHGDKGCKFDTSAIRYDVTRLTNASLPYIIPSFSAGGVNAFLKLENQQMPVPAIYPIQRFSPNTNALNLPLALDGAQPDFDGLYKNYNYELFYHIPIFAAKTLRDFGNYSDAKKWLEYIYSPLATEQFITSQTFTPVISNKESICISVLTETKLITAVSEQAPQKYRVKYGFCFADFVKAEAHLKLKKAGLLPEEIENVVAILSNYTLGGSSSYCWQFFPFRSRTIEDLMEDLNESAELRNYHNNPFDPHAIASLRIGAYEKFTVLEYVDLLTQWGDREFAKLTWDSISNASTLYSMANDVLGKKPAILRQRASEDIAKCFDDLYTQTEYANTYKITQLLEKLTVALLNAQDGNNANSLCDTTNTEFFFPYFKIPVNTGALAKWDIVADRLMKIRNNLDINGSPRNIPLFPPAANPLQLARSRAAGYASSSAKQPTTSNNWYRYSVLYSYAKEFSATLIQFSAQLLSSIEKGDTEALSVMSVQQSAKLVAFTKLIRKNSIDELEKEKKALTLVKTAANKRHDYYKDLVKENISTTEIMAITQNIAAGTANLVSSVLATTGGVVALLPRVGSPFAMVYGGEEFNKSMMNFSAASSHLAATLSTSAGVTETFAEYARRLAEWKMQESQAQSEIDHIDTQLAINELRQNTAKLEQKNTDLLDIQATELIDFYQTKFSSYNLYSALSGLLRRMVFNAYQTATELFSRAERAWQEETDDDTSFLTYTHWDDAKCGLLSGETLLSALDTMQAAYIAKNPRRLEITKTISLADSCPSSFAQLQSGNSCDFTLPLSVFDVKDKPDNYLHKIRSVSVSTKVAMGAQQNISAKLTQTSSVILADPKSGEAVAYVAKFDHYDAAVPLGVISNRRSGQSISISNTQNETGMHFYDTSDGAYLPFEGTGVVSRWKLEYGGNNPFSPKDISDIILNIAYTAVPSGKA